MSDPTLPLIRNCVLISLGTIGVEVSGDAVLVDNQIEAATTNILVNAGGTAYVLGDEQTTYSGAGIVEPLAGDRAVWDALNYAARHTNDTDNVAGIHHTQAALDLLYQPIDATLTAIAALADAAGVLTNDGAGALSWESAGHVIQDEGTPLTQRANLNFVGTHVTATDDAGNDATVITVDVVGEVLMADGIIPPDPITTEDETDWLYEG